MSRPLDRVSLSTLIALGGSSLGFESVSFIVSFVDGKIHVRPLAGRMTREEVALVLRTNKEGVSHLVKLKLLKTLGTQRKRKQLLFSPLVLFGQMSDIKWLSKITDVLCRFAEQKNRKGPSEPAIAKGN
jgi:hypothetical protein